MPPTLADRLRHILTGIEDIKRMLAGRSPAEFASDRILQLAVERSFEILREASRHIPTDMKEAQSDIAWQNLADLGNRLRDAYHRVDPGILWNIIENDLDPLKRFIERVVAQTDPS